MRYGLVFFPTMFIERFVNIYLKNKSCAALISKMKCHISDSRSYTGIRMVAEVNK